ncbi:hypothetical protein [Microbacterium sp. PAMC21962]|uniref:hypothetical protein n=1 Tax=Microbacterium sp. PAMC21962 TaxID=2861280 RepID=UPI001C62D501|nr:hypothetical protein [Microbacterium sp. PAMC21962]QYF98921.1 hypothetical protein KY498_06825 [Microbacterium sp. PAMC21962]
MCETCRKRIRGLLRIAPDLLGRLRALAGHGKAVVYSPVKTFAAASTAPDQVDAEVADALIEISQNLRDWSRWINMHTLDGVDRILADADQTLRLAAAVIDMHTPDEDGGRHWSIADAASRWGVERRDRSTFVYQDDADDVEILINPIPEPRFDPLLITRDAAKRAQVTERQLRNWVAAGELAPRATLRDGRGVMTRWYRQSEVDATAARMRAAAVASQFRPRRAAPA